jgi:phosphatidylserine decarboxylase
MGLERASETGTGASAQSHSAFARLAILMRIAPEGLPIALCVAVPAILAMALGLPWTGVILLLLAAAAGAFFRDPERVTGASPQAILSGADGKVCEVREAPIPGGPRDEIYHQVSVFMSPLNVHVNRAPAAGKITDVRHTAGEFRAAFSDQASEHNERNMITFEGEGGRRYVMVQVAGYLARRIVCRVWPQETIGRGQRLGLIMFGSRVDHFFPRDCRITVNVGDRVRGGISVIGELNDRG